MAKRRDVPGRPREEEAASRADGSGRTSKRRKGGASLSCQLGAQVMSHSRWNDKGRNLVPEGVGREERRELISPAFAGTWPWKESERM